MKLTITAESNVAFLTTESGHDVARIERITPSEWPDLEAGNYLSDDGWQELIDSLHAPMTACYGLDIPANVEAGILAELVSHARQALQNRVEAGRTNEPGGVFKAIEKTLAKLNPVSPHPEGWETAGEMDAEPVSPEERYYAIVAADKSGPAYGVGETPDEAAEDAVKSGFVSPGNMDEVRTIEITPMSYAAVKAGNPHAWLEVEDA